MQPIDYTSAFGQNPMGGFVNALQAGQQFGLVEQQRQAAAQQQQMLQQQQQAASLRQQQIAEAMGRLMAKPNRTFQDYEQVATLLPKEAADGLRANFEALTKEQQRNKLQSGAQVWSAVKSGQTDVALKLLGDYAEGERNAGREDVANAYETWSSLIKANPSGAELVIGGEIAALPGGKDFIESAGKIQEQRRQPEIIQVLSALGLEPTVDNIARYEDAKRGEPTDVQLMRKLGLPVTPEGLSRLEEIRNRGKGPLVTVQTPGQMLPPTALEQAVDKKGADVYVAWKMEGGEANSAARITQLQDVVRKLEKNPNLTGPAIQLIPEWARPLLVPGSVAARQNADRIIQEGMRGILGSQFTQAESDAFMKRAFDPALGADENARRLRLILTQMKSSARQAREVSEYVEKNRTLQGFKGTVPTLADFEGAIAPRGGGFSVTAPNGQVLSFPNQEAANAFKKAAGIP